MTHWPVFWHQFPVPPTGQCVTLFQHQIFAGICDRRQIEHVKPPPFTFSFGFFNDLNANTAGLQHSPPQNRTHVRLVSAGIIYQRSVIVSSTRRLATVAGARKLASVSSVLV